MPRSKSGGRLKTSTTAPQLFSQKNKTETEIKYFGLVRDNALSDLESSDKALSEVLKDIQDPAEASTLGLFTAVDLQVIDGIVRNNLKKEDLEVLRGSSINAEEEETGNLTPLVNPRQRISDRITQAEGFAGRGTVYQGQGTVMYKYLVPTNEPYSHAVPPPFFTEAVTSVAENSPDFIPQTQAQIESTHRVGFVQGGEFVPDVETEWWWNGEYNHEFADISEYGDETQTALTNPKYPIVRDGNIRFDQILPRGINSTYNWGLRFDTWFKQDFFTSSTFSKWVAQVNGHLRVDYFEKTGYDSSGVIQGSWKTALNTYDPSTYFTQLSRENATSTPLGGRLYYLQGGPTTPLGSGIGAPSAPRPASNGGIWDLLQNYNNLEGNAVRNFDNDYVPVVIRFWYGQPASTPGLSVVDRQPAGPASFFLQQIQTDLVSDDLGLWNDYSAPLSLVYSADQGAWRVDIAGGASNAGEANFQNFNGIFEVVLHTNLNASKPGNLLGYTTPSTIVIATKTEPIEDVTYATFAIPGFSPSDENTVWVIARNRPFNVLPGTASREVTSLWQNYLFNPSPTNRYKSVADLLDSGENYVEPDPAKIPFDENLEFYKAVYGELPLLNTYGPARYDGMLANSITTSNTQRDYDYQHSKSLFIGRQKKGTISEIGDTPPLVGKNLAPGETRNKGENYTFIEVVENDAGFGGSITINAFPDNNLGVVNTSSLTTYGKMLHMADNTATFSNPSRQNISQVQPVALPEAVAYSSTARILYEEIDGQGRFVYGTWDGTTFTRDTTGIIAQLTMGATLRAHAAKSGFVPQFVKGSTPYSFYGLIGVQRQSFEGVSITVNSGDTTFNAPGGIFVPDSAGTNNTQYIGSEIIFPNDATVRRVTAYNAATGVVTFSPSKPAGVYAGCDIWYNHLQVGGSLPSNIVDANGDRIVRTSIIPVPGGANIADRLIQLRLVFSSAYQFLRADNGAGLSFGETLYVKQAGSPSQIQPFSGDTELPAPPADIVVPFGYDNTPSSSNPGLGGLCYPPYSVQNIDLQGLVKNDTTLYSAPTGQFDVWWGGRISDPSSLGGRYLYVTDKLLFDFSDAERSNLLTALSSVEKPTFSNATYTHKLEVELNVGLPTNPTNSNLYNDAKFHSNNKPVKDKYYLFIARQQGGNGLSVLSANNPAWT